MDDANVWRKCSSCKKSISLGSRYFVCSVSTCNNQRTGYVFCSVHCFERHLPGARHKDAGAVESTAPRFATANEAGQTVQQVPTQAAAQNSTRTPNRVLATSPATTSKSSVQSSGQRSGANVPREVLVVASRLKEYIQARSEYNTSGAVMDVLSDHIRVVCDRAIDNARAEGRKTVLDRDFDFLRKA